LSDDRKPKPNHTAAPPQTTTAEAVPSEPAPVSKAVRVPKPSKEVEPLKLHPLAELQRLVLVSLPAFSVTELAERLDVTRPSASRALHGLASLGLVAPADGEMGGWKSAWKLTRAGERAAADLSLDSLRRIRDLLADRPHNLPAEAEAIMADAQDRLGALL